MFIKNKKKKLCREMFCCWGTPRVTIWESYVFFAILWKISSKPIMLLTIAKNENISFLSNPKKIVHLRWQYFKWCYQVGAVIVIWYYFRMVKMYCLINVFVSLGEVMEEIIVIKKTSNDLQALVVKYWQKNKSTRIIDNIFKKTHTIVQYNIAKFKHWWSWKIWR